MTRFTHVVLANMANHNLRRWTYGLFGPAMCRLYILRQNYPPYGTIHKTMVDNRPISVVVSDTNRWDYRGKVAVDMGQYRLADSLLTLYLGVDPHSETMLIMKTLADAALGDIDDVYDRAKIGISRYLKDYLFMYYFRPGPGFPRRDRCCNCQHRIFI